MAQLPEQGGRDSPYRRRKITIEPVFGQKEQARRFGQLLQSGLQKARLEWTAVCLAHKVTKLFASHAKPKDRCGTNKVSRRKTLV